MVLLGRGLLHILSIPFSPPFYLLPALFVLPFYSFVDLPLRILKTLHLPALQMAIPLPVTDFIPILTFRHTTASIPSRNRIAHLPFLVVLRTQDIPFFLPPHQTKMAQLHRKTQTVTTTAVNRIKRLQAKCFQIRN